MQLVTGASGFIGQHLVRYLSEKGATVRALYHSHEPGTAMRSLPGVIWMQCNMLDIYDMETALQDVTHIYHCAAIVSFDTADKERLYHFNTESTANLVNITLGKDITKIVYLSSVASLGRSEETKVITEEEQWEESKYNSVYAMSKHAAELEIWRGIGEGLNAVIVNPGIVIGEGNWNAGTGRFMQLADREFPFYTEGITAWIDVQDVVNIMHLLMHSNIHSERFILSAGNYSYKDVFTWMAESLGKEPPRIKSGSGMSAIVWRWGALKKLFTGKVSTVTRETARTAHKQSFYDNTKLSTFLPGISYTPIKQTIARMARVYKSEHK